MKFFATLLLVGLLLFITSCGSSRGGHCDAYGSVGDVVVDDLAQR